MTSDLEEAYLFTKCEAMSWCTYVNDGLARVNNQVVCSCDSNLLFVYSIVLQVCIVHFHLPLSTMGYFCCLLQ